MSQRSVPHELAVLRRCWHRWTAIIELFARRRRRRRLVRIAAYAEVYGTLILASRALAVADESRQELCRHVEDLVRPWMSPRVLERTDRELLRDLLAQCRIVSQTLDPWALRWATLRKAGWLVPVLAAGVTLIVFPELVDLLVRLLPNRLFDLLDQLWFVFKTSSVNQKLLLAVALVILTSIRVVARAARG